MSRASSGAIEGLVFDFLVSSCDTILQDRRGILNPITNTTASFADNADFCRQTLQSWKKDLSKPLIVDLYIFDPRIHKHILMERWKFFYQRANDLKDTKQFNVISRRIVTLLRTLHSYVRMLPGFNYLTVSPKLPTLSFQLYEQKSVYPTGFVSDTVSYRFDQVSTSKGLIIVSVKYMSPPFLKEILVNINGGSQLSGIPSTGHSRRNSRSAEEVSAAIPIPNKDPQSHSHGAGHDERDLFHGKHLNSRLPQAGSSQDPTAENSSVSSTGTLGSASAAVTGSTPPLGSRYPPRTTSRDRETMHRRSFQLPTHAEYGEYGASHSTSSTSGEGPSEAVRQLQQQHRQGQQATSLDSYSSMAQHYMNSQGHGRQPESEGGRSKSFRLSPSHGGGGGGGAAPGTSYGNSYSMTSTPPFSLGELAQQADRYSSTGSDAELGQEPSLPYPAPSSSLKSTSPHFGSNMLALLDKRGGGGGSVGGNQLHWRQAGGILSEDGRSFMFNPTLKTGRVSPSSGLDLSELKVKFHPLPASPFVGSHPAARALSSDNLALGLQEGSRASSMALVPSLATTPRAGGVSPKPRLSEMAATARSVEEDSTLDAFRLHESQRLSMENADGLDLHAFRMSTDSNRSGRQPSKDRSSDGNDADEELPFAWADSEMMGHTVAAPAIAADSVGAPLLYGLSKLSIHPGAVHRGMGGGAGLVGAPTQRNQSTYTGAGLSGELLGKINEFKSFSSTLAK